MGFEFNSNGEKFQPVAVVSNGGVGHAGCDAAVRSDETVKITAEFAENRALVERVHDEHRRLRPEKTEPVKPVEARPTTRDDTNREHHDEVAEGQVENQHVGRRP